MIEACDRLGQRLDEVAGLFREQMEAWRRIGPSAVPAARSENALHRGVETPAAKRASAVEEMPPAAPTTPEGPMREQPPEKRREASATLPPASIPQDEPATDQRRDAAATLPSGERAPAPQPGATAGGGLVEMAQDARRMADTLAGSGQSWPEQAAGVQQALESIMAYLENQAATAAPKVDVAGILGRLSDLEEQQKNLQSQFNNNR
jgi:hypothetical protein